MKRIEFIPGIESMRGNLSGSQTLKYAKNNNPAFYAPEGKQYARNYGASYIGAKRSSDGLKFFSVKRRSATKIDAGTLLQMAAFGAAAATVASIFRNKTSQIYGKALAIHAVLKQTNPEIGSLRKWLTEGLLGVYKNKLDSFQASVVAPGSVTISMQILNIFVGTSILPTPGAELSDSLISKFWMQLATSPVKYPVSGADIALIGHSNEQFLDLLNSGHNVLKLQTSPETGDIDAICRMVGTSKQYLNVRDNAGIVGHDFTVYALDEINPQQGNVYYFSNQYLPQGEGE